jgi:hypothetical protein
MARLRALRVAKDRPTERGASNRRPDKVLMALKLQQRSDGAIDEYDAFQGQLPVGRLYKRTPSARPGAEWIWALNGVIGLPLDVSISGVASTREEALSALTKLWAWWLEQANLVERQP